MTSTKQQQKATRERKEEDKKTTNESLLNKDERKTGDFQAEYKCIVLDTLPMVCGIPAKIFKHELKHEETMRQILDVEHYPKQWSGFFKKSMSETKKKRHNYYS